MRSQVAIGSILLNIGVVSVLIQLLVFAELVQAEGKGIIIVASPSISYSQISASDLRRVYLGKMKKWPNGMRIKVAQIKQGVLAESFSEQVMKKPLKKYKLYWKRVVAAGTGIPPRSFKTQHEILEYVRNTEGAMGYVSSSGDTEGLVILDLID